jgi:hypothetical protein
MFDRKPPQQDRVHQCEDRGVRADAQRQREGGHNRKTGILDQHP